MPGRSLATGPARSAALRANESEHIHGHSRLKSINCVAGEGSLLLSLDPRTCIEVADATGQVQALLVLLRDGTRSPAQLRDALAERWPDMRQHEVHDALAMLDGLGWLEDVAAPARLSDYERERYFSNLAFFDAYTTLERDREEIQQRLIDARVVVLGAGWLGSSVIQNLVGFGVTGLTLLDCDTVALRNFARQFAYSEAQLGQSKVEQVAGWVRAFDARAEVTAVDARVTGPGDVRALLGGADLVISAIDEPDEVDLWVNEACVGEGVPFIRGGLAYMQGLYWSVDPGRSACRQCLEHHREALGENVERRAVTWERVRRSERVNRGIGPVAQLLGSLVAMEPCATSLASCRRSPRAPTSSWASRATARSPPTPGRATPNAPCAPPLHARPLPRRHERGVAGPGARRRPRRERAARTRTPPR